MSDTTNPITHVFDQTNGVIEGLDGESDGTAGSEVRSAADRGDDAAALPGDREPRAVDAQPGSSATPDRDAAVPSGSADRRDDATVDRGQDAGRDGAATTSPERSEHTFAVDSSGGAVDEGASGAGERSGHPAHRAEDSVSAVAADRFADRDRTVDAVEGGGAAASTGSDESDVADLSESSATTRTPEAAGPSAAAPAAASDDSIGHVFDQTNGVVEGLEGESDGTAEGDEDSAGDRRGLNEPNPVGQQDAFKDDHYGAEDGTDRNP